MDRRATNGSRRTLLESEISRAFEQKAPSPVFPTKSARTEAALRHRLVACRWSSQLTGDLVANWLASRRAGTQSPAFQMRRADGPPR